MLKIRLCRPGPSRRGSRPVLRSGKSERNGLPTFFQQGRAGIHRNQLPASIVSVAEAKANGGMSGRVVEDRDFFSFADNRSDKRQCRSLRRRGRRWRSRGFCRCDHDRRWWRAAAR